MFFQLMKKECVQYLKSITYYIFCICLAIFFYTQMEDFDSLQKPTKGQEDYGLTRTSDKDEIMQATLARLLWEYDQNSYATYPIGFYKQVTLDEKQQQKIKESIIKCSEMTEKDFDAYAKGTIDAVPTCKLSFQEFSQEMEKVADLLGRGSNYGKEHLKFTYHPKTYEEAKREYESLIRDDKITNAYARLFCDYMGILLSMMPVFLAVGRVLRDRRAQAEQVIHMKPASSMSIVFSRYFAAVLMSLLPVLLLSIQPLLQCAYFAKHVGAAYDAFAFVRHIVVWLLPNIFVCLSLGFFVTELTDSVVAVLIQGAWWFCSIFIGTTNLVGGVGWNLVPRFNTVGHLEIFEQMRGQLIKNRMLYTAISMALLLLTVFLYGKKRKGEFASVRKRFVNRKNKLEA